MGWTRQTQKPQVPEGSVAFPQQGWIAHFNELPSEAWGEHFSLGGRSPTPKGDGWAVDLLTADPSTNYPALREPPNANHSAATASPFEKFVENADPNLTKYLLRLVEAKVRTFFPDIWIIILFEFFFILLCRTRMRRSCCARRAALSRQRPPRAAKRA